MRNLKTYYIYILTNKHHTVYYTGVTSNLINRIYQHKNKLVEGFTSKYKVDKLVYFEEYSEAELALNREKQIKGYRRSKKLELIKSLNPRLEEIPVV